MKKRILSCLLAGVIACMSCVSAQAVETDNEALYLSVSDTEGTFAAEYIQAHLDFVDSESYLLKFANSRGGLSSVLSENYEEAGLNYVNGAWDLMDTLGSYFSSGQVTDQMKRWLQDGSPYDVVLTELLENYIRDAGYMENINEKNIQNICAFLETSANILSKGSDLTDKTTTVAVDALERAQASMDLLAKNGTGLITYDQLLNVITKEIDLDASIFKMKEINKTVKWLNHIGNTLDSLEDIFQESFTDMLFAATLISSEEEWLNNLLEVSTYAGADGTAEGRKIESCLRSNVSDIRANADSRELQAAKIIREASGNAFETQIRTSLVSEFLEAPALKNEYGVFIKIGTMLGIDVSKGVTNMDQVSLNGSKMYLAGNMAPYFWDLLINAETELRVKQDYESALKFDSAFRLYKQLQILTYDYAIDYCSALLDTPVNAIPGMSVNYDKHADIVQLQVEKAEWESVFCHYFATIPRVSVEGSLKYGNTDEVWHAVSDVEVVLEDAPEIAEKINGSDWFQERLSWAQTQIENLVNINQTGFLSFYYDFINQAYATQSALSMVFYRYTAYGNARASQVFVTFDLTTGEQLDLWDILAEDNSEAEDRLKDQILYALQRRMQSSPEDFFMKAEDAVAELLEYEYSFWCFTEEGLKIVYPEYMLGPGSLGEVDTIIPWSMLTGIVSEKYLPIDYSGCEAEEAVILRNNAFLEQKDILSRERISILWNADSATGCVYVPSGAAYNVQIRKEEVIDGAEYSIFYYSTCLTEDSVIWLPADGGGYEEAYNISFE